MHSKISTSRFFLSVVVVSIIFGFLDSVETRADLLISITEVGDDVVVTAEGSLNIDLLTYIDTVPANDIFVDADSARVISGTAGFASVDRYNVPQGPTSFGPGIGASFADFGSGDRVGILGSGTTESELLLPAGFVSGDSISSSMTFLNETISSLGLNEGTYMYSWGIVPIGDSVVVNISQAIPEPGLGGLGVFGLAGIVFGFRQRR